MSGSERERLAKENGMTVEFVDWFFDTKKEGCGNVWFMMMAAMWEGWKAQEARCAALAAENARLKEFCKDAAFDADYEAELGMERGGFTDALNAIKTPATDAFLAEVRASAIDSLVDIKTKKLADMHPDTHAFGATAMSIRSQINELQVFAAQLRQEAAQ